MNRCLFAAVLRIPILWLALISAGAAGQTLPDPTPTPLPPGIRIAIEANPKTATVGDPIRIDLDITMPAGYRAEMPKLGKQAGDFAILDFFPGPVVPESGDDQKPSPPAQAGVPTHHRARIVAAVYKTGKFLFPPIPLKLKTAEGTEVLAATPQDNIEIRSVLTEKDRDLKDLRKQAEIPDPFRWVLWLIAALACLILVIAAWLVWKRARRKQPVSFSPEQTESLLELAEADLKELLARGLPESGTEKGFYILLSEIVKRILEPGYEIPTAERTTEEIMESLRHGQTTEPENIALTESFLLRCDVVKFAKYVPSRIEHEDAAKDALRILEQARKAVASRQSSVASGSVVSSGGV